MPSRFSHLMCSTLSCSRLLNLRAQSRQKSGKDALATWNCLSARIITGLSVFAVFCIPMPPNPLSTGLPVLATTAVVGGLVCARFDGAIGDGLIGAAAARAGVVGEVTAGMIGAGIAATEAAPGAACGSCATGAIGAPATTASLAEVVPCTFIDELSSADAAASSEAGALAEREHPAIGSAASPSKTNPAANPFSVFPPRLMFPITSPGNRPLHCIISFYLAM